MNMIQRITRMIEITAERWPSSASARAFRTSTARMLLTSIAVLGYSVASFAHVMSVTSLTVSPSSLLTGASAVATIVCTNDAAFPSGGSDAISPTCTMGVDVGSIGPLICNGGAGIPSPLRPTAFVTCTASITAPIVAGVMTLTGRTSALNQDSAPSPVSRFITIAGPPITRPICSPTATLATIIVGQSSTLSANCNASASASDPRGVVRTFAWSGPSLTLGGLPPFATTPSTVVAPTTLGVNRYNLQVCDAFTGASAADRSCLDVAVDVTVRAAVVVPVCNPTANPNRVAPLQSSQLQANCSVPASGVTRVYEWLETSSRFATTESTSLTGRAAPGIRSLTLNVCDTYSDVPTLAPTCKSFPLNVAVTQVVAAVMCNPVATPNPVTVLQSAQLQSGCTSPASGITRSVEWVEGATRFATAETTSFQASATPGLRTLTLNVCDKATTNSPANNLIVGRFTGCDAVQSRSLDVTTVGSPAMCSSLTANVTGNRPIGSSVTLSAACSGAPAITTYTWFNATTNVQLARTPTNTFEVTVPIGGITVRVTPDNGIAGATGAQITLAAEAPVVAAVAQASVTMAAGEKREFKVTVRSSTGAGIAGVPVTWTDVEQQSKAANTVCGAASGTSQTVNTDATGTATISYTFPANSCGRTLTATAAGVSTNFKLVSAAVTVIQPAQQAVQAIAQIALVAPQVQLNNIRSRQEQLRSQGAQPKVKSDLRVSATGTPIPIGAIIELFGSDTQAKGLNASGDDFERWGVFLNGDVELGSYNANNGFKGFDARSRGITFGADYRFDGNHAIGIGLGAARSKAEIADAGGQQESRGTSVALFGSFIPSQDTYIDGTVLFGRMNYEVSRAVRDDKNVLLGMATAKPDGNQMAVALSAGANFNVGPFRVNPYGRFERISATIDGFAESGPQALSITEQKVAVSTVSAGAQLTGTFNTSFAVLQPNMRLEFSRNIRDSRRAVFASLVNDANPLARFALATALDDKSYGTVGVGLSFLFQRGITAFVQIEESFASESSKRRRYSFGVRVPL